MTVFDTTKIQDYEWAKKHLMIRAALTAENKDKLSKVVHMELYDMSVFYSIVITDDNSNHASFVLVNDSLLNRWGITVEQLWDDAQKYAPMNFPVKIQSMKEMFAELMRKEGMLVDEDLYSALFTDGLYVATCHSSCGAGCMFYPEFMDQAAEKMRGDFYVIPSSIHEVLLLPDGGFTAKELDAMVRTVNANEIEPKERLSEYVYHYEVSSETIERATEWDERKGIKR